MKSKNVVFFLCFYCLTLTISAQDCLPAADFIAIAFQKHNIIGLDEGPHATIQTHAFLRQLLNSKKVNSQINYIILELANTNYQNTLDRYISGQNVPLNELKKVWRNGSQAHNEIYGEVPVYLHLLQTIRSINMKRRKKDQIRVLGGDPPFNWKNIQTQKDYFKSLGQRDLFPAHLAEKYGIDQNKKVLLIYGGEHFGKISDEKMDSTHWNIDYIVNKYKLGAMITIATLNLSKKQLGNISEPANVICNSSDNYLSKKTSFQLPDGSTHSLDEIYDAFYFIGPNDNWKKDQIKTIDKNYFKELDRRARIVWGEGLDPKLEGK